MTSILIKHADIIMKNKILKNHSVYCSEGKIEKIITEAESLDTPVDHIYDAKGYYLAPGYIDLHIHGAMNKIVDNGPEEICELTSILPQYGVTGFLPTLTPKTAKKRI